MPNKNDIITAVNNLDVFLRIDDLKGATVKKNANGQPFFFTGGFNMVFQLEKQSKIWAFRVWHINIQNIKERFQKISDYLTKQKLPYFADFIYDEKGLLVNGELLDTIRMEWLDGLLLKDYIEKNLNNKQKLQELAESFLTMYKELHSHNISHGDLQHGNILIDNQDKIVLIDYDSVCVPDIEGKEELVSGLIGYQHPSRINSKNKASLKADYFSELIIYFSILAISEKPSLWSDYQVKDTNELLFNEEDFKDFTQSKIYQELSNISKDEIKDLLKILNEYLKQASYLDLEPFDEALEKLNISFILSDTKIRRGKQSAELSWSVKNASEVLLFENNTEIQKCKLKNKIIINPQETTIYKLQITAFEKKTVTIKELTLYVFDESIIDFKSDKEYVFPEIPITLTWDVKNAKEVELVGYGNVEENGAKNFIDGINQETTFELKVTDEFGVRSNKLTIKMLPVPQITSLLIPTPQIQSNINIQTNISLICANLNIPQTTTMDVSLEAPFQLSTEELDLSIEEPKFTEPKFQLPSKLLFWSKLEDKLKQIKIKK